MRRLLLIWLLMTLPCTACAALPAEERSFAVVLAVDKNGSAWTVHARIPTYQTGGGYTTASGEGNTLAAALAAADAASPMELHLGQLRLLIFSSRLAGTTGFREAMEVLAARNDLRPGACVAVTEAALPDLMEALNPTTGARLSKSLDVLMETRIEQGTALPSALADILRMGERQQSILMNVTLEEGAVGLSGGWPLSAEGTVGPLLSPEDVQLLSVMMGKMTSGTLSLAEGTVTLSQAKAEAELAWPTMQQASLRLTLRYTSSSLTEEALSRSVATACLGVLNRLSGAGCDALGLARQAVIHMGDTEEWHDLGWPDRYREMDWSVSVGAEGPT